MDKILTVGGKEVGFRATALTPRLYRHKIGRDIIQDLNRLRKAYSKALSSADHATEEGKRDAELSAMDLEMFENVAYIMARQYDAAIPDTPDEWLDGFEVFSIYEVLPHILELWSLNEATTAKPKKK